MAPLVVGFDLDMTLIDTRPGIAAVWDALSAETGVLIDSAEAVTRLGPPLDEELGRWFPADQVGAMGDRFRALYPSLAVAPTPAFEGARAAIDAVHRHGGKVVVVTGKYEPNARLHLDHLGLEVDALHGWLWGPAKAEALLEHGASVYVGDHLGDIDGARAANALSVAVPTGPISADELRAAGADVVLEDLGGFPAWLDEHVLAGRLADLDAHLARLGRVTVAFSGGADSAFLLAAAARVLGADNVLAATAVSGSLPDSELAAARAFAADLGVEHVTPDTHELDRPGYAANAGDRCYFCKAELLDVLLPVAAERGHVPVATGTNADDAVAGFRPGIRAAAERGAATPLRDAGLTKAQVRTASRRLGLPTWDKPAAACLSSRIAYGISITPARLARVERAESALRASLAAAGLDVRDVRVRDLGETARIEVDDEKVAQVAAAVEVIDAVRATGFDTVEVDPRGFRSGAMNELLDQPDRFR
ncbi:MAG: ATP-dependent sacrificial sulfur transferase LarE [Actinomycetes bacterium]